MRTLRLSLVGMVMVALLGGLSGAVVAQDVEAAQTPALVTGTVVDLEQVSAERQTFTEGRVRSINATWRLDQSVSDPRL